MSEWKVGDEVVSYSTGWSRYRIWGRPVKVAKIYKNGNVVLENGPQQYRPFGDNRLTPTGQGIKLREIIVRNTDAVKAERKAEVKAAAHAKRIDDAARLLCEMERDHPEQVPASLLAQIEVLGGEE